MAAAIFKPSRRSLLRGMPASNGWVARPPWAVSDALFPDACERCDACVQACPAHIVARGSGGFPELSFSDAGCDFCGACLRACQGRALRATTPDPAAAFRHRVQIAGDCLANHGVGCRVCGDFCDARAIRFHLRAGAPPIPELDPDRCTGCGQCIAPCPARAIGLSPNPTENPHG